MLADVELLVMLAMERGRWRRNKKQVDVYIEIWLPYPDALIARKLCGPAGLCQYALRKLE